MSEIVLIREFDPPIDAGYLEAASVDLGWCRELYGVAPLLHFLARDGRRCACIFGAPDAEAVRNVLRAGNRSEPEGLWACTVHSADDDDGAVTREECEEMFGNGARSCGGYPSK